MRQPSDEAAPSGEVRRRGWRSASTRAAFVEYRTGRRHSEQTRAAIAAAQTGRVLSADTRHKMSITKIVRIPSLLPLRAKTPSSWSSSPSRAPPSLEPQ